MWLWLREWSHGTHFTNMAMQISVVYICCAPKSIYHTISCRWYTWPFGVYCYITDFCISCKIHLASLDGCRNNPMGSRRVLDNDIMIDHIISLLFHRILVTRDFLGMSKDVVRSLNCVSCSSLVKQQFLGAFMTSSSDILLPL